jgi:hypothetical protein
MDDLSIPRRGFFSKLLGIAAVIDSGFGDDPTVKALAALSGTRLHVDGGENVVG